MPRTLRSCALALVALGALACQAGPRRGASGPPAFVHMVLFWLRDDATAAARDEFAADLRGLAAIPSVRRLWVGPPAGVPRDVVDNSFSLALVVHFADRAGHDVYQDHPIHLAMIEKHRGLWTRVQVYDALGE